MQIKKLFKEFDILQKQYGDSKLNAIYGAGKINSPKVSFVFMNPTAKNQSSKKEWSGIRAPWIGSKKIWELLYSAGFLNKNNYLQILEKKGKDWNEAFAETIYKNITSNSIYITNLSKATQIDARPLKNIVFKKYLDLFKEEMNIINPKIIISFGNQVSSIILNKNISVSKYRRKYELLEINNRKIKVFPVYYPVGQGTRNLDLAKKDIKWIIKNHV